MVSFSAVLLCVCVSSLIEMDDSRGGGNCMMASLVGFEERKKNEKCSRSSISSTIVEEQVYYFLHRPQYTECIKSIDPTGRSRLNCYITCSLHTTVVKHRWCAICSFNSSRSLSLSLIFFSFVFFWYAVLILLLLRLARPKRARTGLGSRWLYGCEHPALTGRTQLLPFVHRQPAFLFVLCVFSGPEVRRRSCWMTWEKVGGRSMIERRGHGRQVQARRRHHQFLRV